jgi:hypothetical protein
MLTVRLLCTMAIGCVLASLAFVDASQAPPAAQSVPPPSLTVGVVRSDGFLVPVATKTPDGHWTALSGIEVIGDRSTIRIRDRASLPRDGWTFHPAGGAASRPLAIRDEVTAEAHCMRQEALATDASRPGPPGTDRRAWGIATHGAAPALPVENVADQPDAESRRVARVIVQLTHALEADRAAQPSSRLAAITPDQRGRVPVVITRLDRVRTTWQDSYYFEAQKDYGRIRAFAGGWALSSAAGFSLVQVDAGVEGASGETTRRRGHVLGALQVGPAVVWIVEMQGYEGSSYALVDVGLPRQTLSVPGGGC